MGAPEIQWVVFWGGPDPDNCAGFRVVADEAEAHEDASWVVNGDIARREVSYGPWQVWAGGDGYRAVEPEAGES